VIFLGLSLVGFALGSFTRAVIEFELASFFGRRRMEKEIARLKDHYIICGAGRVGRRIANEISARGFPVVGYRKGAGARAMGAAAQFPGDDRRRFRRSGLARGAH
jgi:phosphoglycerate dehydrogenase-like enzyme